MSLSVVMHFWASSSVDMVTKPNPRERFVWGFGIGLEQIPGRRRRRRMIDQGREKERTNPLVVDYHYFFDWANLGELVLEVSFDLVTNHRAR